MDDLLRACRRRGVDENSSYEQVKTILEGTPEWEQLPEHIRQQRVDEHIARLRYDIVAGHDITTAELPTPCVQWGHQGPAGLGGPSRASGLSWRPHISLKPRVWRVSGRPHVSPKPPLRLQSRARSRKGQQQRGLQPSQVGAAKLAKPEPDHGSSYSSRSSSRKRKQQQQSQKQQKRAVLTAAGAPKGRRGALPRALPVLEGTDTTIAARKRQSST